MLTSSLWLKLAFHDVFINKSVIFPTLIAPRHGLQPQGHRTKKRFQEPLISPITPAPEPGSLQLTESGCHSVLSELIILVQTPDYHSWQDSLRILSYTMLLDATNSVMDETELRNSLVALHSASFGWATVCCRGDRQLAEDVLQSVYVSVLDGRARFGGRSSYRTWLFAVIRNSAREQRRKRWWSGAVRMDFESLAELTDSANRRELNAGEDEKIAAIRDALGRLPERQRQVAHLVFYEDMTIADAADVMSVRIGTARQHYARGKETLKALLKPLQDQT